MMIDESQGIVPGHEQTSMSNAQKNIVSIIIPNRNRSDDLIQCLESIKKQRFRDYEVIIVDDDSKKKNLYSHPIFQGLQVQVIANVGRRGAASAKNSGARAAQGTLIMFLDSDSELLDEHVIDNVIEIMGQDSQIGAIGGEIERGDGGKYLVPLRTISPRTGEVIRTFVDHRNLHLEIEYLSTCNLTVRKSLFEQIDGFEEIFQTYYEDADFCLRLRKLGCKIVMDSLTLAIHHRSREARHSSKLNFLSTRNRFLFVIFHGRIKDFFRLPFREGKKLIHAWSFFFWAMLGMIWNVSKLPLLLRIKKRRNR